MNIRRNNTRQAREYAMLASRVRGNAQARFWGEQSEKDDEKAYLAGCLPTRCSGCGEIQQMPLSVRVYDCCHCGLLIDRDHNASHNILKAALEAVGRHSRIIPEASAL